MSLDFSQQTNSQGVVRYNENFEVTPQTPSKISSDKGIRSSTSILNNSVGIEGITFQTQLTAVTNSIRNAIVPEILESNISAQDADQVPTIVINALDRLSGTSGFEEGSLGDLMLQITLLLLDTVHDRRRADAETFVSKREQAAQTAVLKFELGKEAAEAEKDASRKQAIGQIVAGSVGVLMSVTSMVLSAIGGVKSNNAIKEAVAKKASGNVDTKANIPDEELGKIGDRAAAPYRDAVNIINNLNGSVSQIITGAYNLAATSPQFAARMLNLTVDILQNFIQFTNENAARDTEDLQQIRQEVERLISMVQQAARNIAETNTNIGRNFS